jgi:hypothetical protein
LLPAQFINEVRDEPRKPILVSGKAALACRLSASGQILAGAGSSKGGSVSIKNLAGGRVLALTASIRLHGRSGLFADSVWRGDVLSQGAINDFKLVPEAFAFRAGVAPIEMAELIVLGIVYDDHSTCGEQAAATKGRFYRRVESYLKDLEEALSASKTLPAKDFEEKVRAGLLEAGPYARETSPAANATLMKYLIGPDLILFPDATERIQTMLDPVEKYGPEKPEAAKKSWKGAKPSKQARPKQ